MATPHKKMAIPEMGWMYFSKTFHLIFDIPQAELKTTVNIVKIVTAPNTPTTQTKFHQLPLAAGYMTNGISGSHGPKTKTTN